MKKIAIYISTLLIALFIGMQAFAYSTNYTVEPANIHQGYSVQKIWLSSYADPTVTISDINYITNVALPKDATSGDPAKFTVRLGMDRKRAFAVISVPVYASGGNGSINQVSSYTLNIAEAPVNPTTAGNTAAKTTDVATSVLAAGTWYKIAITKTGLYKLDASFFTSMGISLSDINPANIRICGNGGNMLSEDNSVPRPSDLAENAIWVNDGGDNAFNTGDYVVFYGVGTTAWYKDSLNHKFYHQNNLYADTAYYFVSINSGTGLRVQAQPSVPAHTVTSSGFDYYDVHELDAFSPTNGYGKTWYGEKFLPQYGTNSFSFNFDLGDVVTNLNCKVAFACNQGGSGGIMSATLNGSTLGSIYIDEVTVGGNLVAHRSPIWTGACNSRTADITVNYAAPPSSPSSMGFLDYIELSARRSLNITGDQLLFRDWQVVGSAVAQYSLQSANSFTKVWDITNPQQPVVMNGSLSGSTYSFDQEASRLHEFAAMNSNNLYTPKFIATVTNQNLHGTGVTDFVIVTHPSYIDAATKVANYHTSHDHLRTVVVTTDQVYNEFSSGGQDISAIRDYVRMLYKRAGNDTTKMPRYLLLYGGASYDYKNRLPVNSNFIPTLEAANDSEDINSFLSDDFFGFLDDSENAENLSMINTLDIGVGRISSRNITDAMTVADKIVNYKSPATLGPWRLATTFVGDNNDDAGQHMQDAETMAAAVAESGQDLYNEQKIYLNVIPIISTPGGDRCPNANTAINDQIYKGMFMMNYNGHGSPTVLAHERILKQDDFNAWTNANMLPFMITATCDFGQFDHPDFVSAAELVLNKSGGGVIAMITTTQAVFASDNKSMNREYLTAQFTKNSNGSTNTFGDAVRIGKNMSYMYPQGSGLLVNFRKWTLLGDPALTPDFPEYNVKIDSVVDGATLELADTIKALGKYTIKGSVRDLSNNTMTGFNGTVYVSFFDKARTVATNAVPSKFSIQDNIIYKGKVTVTNGLYSITFITPKDINYYMGKGKISTYAENGSTDAAGIDTSISIGSYSDHPVLNDNPPIVKPYINDSSFINGGITGSNTSLFVDLTSETGINVSGYSVGHDLMAVLDGNVELPYILNDYYETAPNTFQKGYVKFPMTGIAEGLHTLKVRAWDVNNNLGEGSVDFVVINGKVVEIQNLSNYPNPFANLTHFVFEHNHPDEPLDIQINIYNASGALARNIKESFTPTGSRTSEITWDGTDNNGSPLPSGVYVYRLNLSTEKGYHSTAYQKLVIIR